MNIFLQKAKGQNRGEGNSSLSREPDFIAAERRRYNLVVRIQQWRMCHHCMGHNRQLLAPVHAAPTSAALSPSSVPREPKVEPPPAPASRACGAQSRQHSGVTTSPHYENTTFSLSSTANIGEIQGRHRSKCRGTRHPSMQQHGPSRLRRLADKDRHFACKTRPNATGKVANPKCYRESGQP